MEVRVLTTDFERFIPRQAMNSKLGRPMEFDEMTFSVLVDEGERINAEPLHHPERSWNSAITHHPKNGVSGLRLKGEEVPEIVVSGLAGRYLVVRLGLNGVDKVGKLHGILDKEHRDVVSIGRLQLLLAGCKKIENVPDNIPITLRGVKLSCESTDITYGVCAAPRALDGREAHEHGCGPRRVGKDRGEGVLRSSVVEYTEVSVSSDTASVDDSFGDTLVVETMNLLHGDLVLKQSGPSAFLVRSLQPDIEYEVQRNVAK